MVNRSTAVRSLRGPVDFCLPGLLIFSFATVSVVPCFAQDQQNQTQQDQSVAEAARQERTRKESQQKKSKHVYTAEDLKREHILTPEDRAAVEARKNQPALPGAPKPQDAVDGSTVARDADSQSLPANSDAPLGDVARRLRQQKESEKLQRSAEFHLPFWDAPVLASPKPPAQPLLPPVTVRPPVTAVQPAPRVVAPFRPFVKRSPFERPRSLPAPPVPAAPPAPRVLPTPPRALAPAPPARVAPSPSISGKLTIVTVKPGDSLWKFAAERLGNGRRWQELLSLNRGLRDPNFLEIGSEIVLPVSAAPSRAPTKYTVRAGVSLWSIAQSQLHHGSYWSCIAQANPAVSDASLIHSGQILILPANCKP